MPPVDPVERPLHPDRQRDRGAQIRKRPLLGALPGLETLITNPLEVRQGGGHRRRPMDSDSIRPYKHPADNPLGATLKATLDGPSLMIVTVEATTSKGRAMSPEQLQRVVQACEMVIVLDKAKKTLTEYVQSA